MNDQCPVCVETGKGELCSKHKQMAIDEGLIFPNGNRKGEICPRCKKDGGEHGPHWFPCALHMAAEDKLAKEKKQHRYPTITKTFTVTSSLPVMKRFERLLAMMHFCSGWGHTSYFGMPLDGDGPDRFKVDEVLALPGDERAKLAKEVEKNMGGDIELAYDESYGRKRFQQEPNVQV